MPLARLNAPFDPPDWMFEVKFDGFRAVAFIEDGAARLVCRKRKVYKSFPDLCTALATAIPVGR